MNYGIISNRDSIEKLDTSYRCMRTQYVPLMNTNQLDSTFQNTGEKMSNRLNSENKYRLAYTNQINNTNR